MIRVIHVLKYADGELYWDLSGRVRRSVTESDKKWVFEPRPAQVPLSDFWKGKRPLDDLGEGLKAQVLHMTFGARQADLTVEAPAPSSVDDLPVRAALDVGAAALKIILTAMGVRTVSRLGTRMWVLHPYATEEEANQAILRSGLCGATTTDIGRPTSGSYVRMLEHDGMTCRVEVGVASVTFHRTGEEVAGVLLDVDCGHEKPPEEMPKLEEHFDQSMAYLAQVTDSVARAMRR